ncbi:MAG: TIGR04283 family arsenosugar biosynthesis glycosyltransferase [Thermodesulfobacteriota bacterium]|nr:TIGR04283 family arsenosugar biosynthesis glycosyltransferase [Thermodesulfobacteriota bacterium]
MAPRLSIIIPVLHEAGSINPTLDAIDAATGGMSTETIVVDGASDGDTLAAVSGRDVLEILSAPGRGTQMNAGATEASGEIFLFLHADTRLPEGAGELIINACKDESVTGGAFDLGIDSPRPGFRMIETIASLRSRLTRIPYGDQAIFIKAAIFRALGGYRPIPIMEDIDLMQRLKRHGYQIRLLRPAVMTSARRWEKEGVCYVTLRNLCLSTLFYLGVSPERLKRFYP